MEAVEGFALGDAVHTLLAEHEGEHPKRLWVDNAAAVSVLSLGPCTWRTRHLRIRAHHVLWRLASTDWLVNYLPGRFQVADLGTKALPVQRVLELKELLNIGRLKSEGEPVKKVALAGLVMLGGSILKGMDSDDAAPQGSDSFAAMFLVIYTVAVIFLTLLISGLARKVFSGEEHRDRSRDRSSSSDEMPGIWGPEGAPGRRRAQAGRSHEADRDGGGAGLHEGLRRRRGSTSDEMRYARLLRILERNIEMSPCRALLPWNMLLLRDRSWKRALRWSSMSSVGEDVQKRMAFREHELDCLPRLLWDVKILVEFDEAMHLWL